MASNLNDLASSWVRDGTVAEAPVTESTPVIEVAAPALPAVETPAVVETPAAEVAPVAIAAPETPEQREAIVAAAESGNAAAIEYLEAKLGDEPFQLPKNLLVPWKRGGETGFAPITEVLSSSMMERDYRHKTQAVATERRTVESEKARIAEERKLYEQERAEFEKALQDPQALANWSAHYEQMANNPVYRKNVEDAREKRLTDAELNVYREEEQQEVLQETVRNLADQITTLGAEYKGVDPERVRAVYAERLQAGRITEITLDSIHQVYREEAQHRDSLLSPVLSELDTLKAQLARIETATASQAHNNKTDAAIAASRKGAPVAITGSGNAPAPAERAKPTPFSSRELPDRIRSWVHQAQ